VVFLIFTFIIENIVDYIIVGQGLAGSSLAMRLMERGKRVIVFDEPTKNHCSRVAAGLFNPITGMGIVKTWMAEEIFSSLHQFYAAAQSSLNETFFFPQLLYRPFTSVEEQNNWMAKSADRANKDFLENIFIASHWGDHLHDPFGGILVKQAGFLDVSTFLFAVRQKLVASELYLGKNFDWGEVAFDGDSVRYKEIEASKVISCSGAEGLSPFFDWLPIRKLKGETITIKLADEPRAIYNKGIYVVPTSIRGVYKVGSTYNLKDATPSITELGRQELEEKLSAILKMPFEVVDQQWGIRPTTVDRKPILGAHPKHPNLIIFNGLGTKGVSLAPYFSGHLADWLVGHGELLPEVNITRFKALYSKS
jgi:glycine oxidase